MSVTALVVDDERLARNRLQRLLSQLGVQVVGQASNGVEAVELAKSVTADLLFIDINMPKLNGLDASREIAALMQQPPAIIFCTAYDEFALQAFDASASAYLLKPVNTSDLQQAIERAGKLNRLQAQLDEAEATQIIVRQSGNVEAIALSSITFFRSIDKNVFAHVIDQGDTLVDYTLKELEDKYASQFVRAHRSVLVSKQCLTKLEKNQNGAMVLHVKGSDEILPVSRRHLAEVKKCFIE